MPNHSSNLHDVAGSIRVANLHLLPKGLTKPGTFSIIVCILMLLVGGMTSRGADATLQLKPGDHIAIIGNTLADRMQQDGWLETFICAKFPKHDLVFRNLAVAGDEVAVRHRSENFGTPDDWL